MKDCPNRDSCKCHGDVPICYHGYFGKLLGTPSDPLPGTSEPVYRVTDADCARCGPDAPLTPRGPSPGPTDSTARG